MTVCTAVTSAVPVTARALVEACPDGPNAVLGGVALLSVIVFWMGLTLPIAAAAAVIGWRERHRSDRWAAAHLLPRLATLGAWAAVTNTALFAFYHFRSPWQLSGRRPALWPLVYFVWRHGNIRVGIIVHLALNVSGLILVVPRILAVS